MPPAVMCAYDELVPLEKIVPYPRNPNRHPKKQVKMLARIIDARGWRAPITVSTRSGFVVRGHGRLEAARFLGLTEAPVDYQDYANEAEEWADLVADNQIAQLADMDNDELSSILQDIKAAGIDIEETGFLEQDLNAMIEKAIELDEEPEVEFTRELLLEHNYVVLYFDNPLDWSVAQDVFRLKKVKDLIPRKSQPMGIGRVLRGAEWLDRLK